MKYYFLLLLLVATASVTAQKIDSATITQAASLIGLDFTAAEKDSMRDGLAENKQHYLKMHQLAIPNSLSYPFAFNPAPTVLPYP